MPPEPRNNPCIPSPCGQYSQCRDIDGFPACSCLTNYIGKAPNCRPECIINEECPGNLACQNEQCIDPCPGSCGINTFCNVIKHNPLCTCNLGYTGNPFTECTPIAEGKVDYSFMKTFFEQFLHSNYLYLSNLVASTTEQPRTPCNPSPCGANAICNERNHAGSCTCLPEYFGDPYIGCRPECVTNSDCDRNKACVNNKCINPCFGACGENAFCRVSNHAPACSCLPGYTGNALNACTLTEVYIPKTPTDPCEALPCGPFSNCRTLNGHAVCSCQPGYLGVPPGCRPECTVSSECLQNKACIENKCADPCPGICGKNTKCLVVNHNPICTCASGYTGDPFTYCEKEGIVVPSTGPGSRENPCTSNLCGPNSQCREINGQPACSCLTNYVGRPPNCRPECKDNSECPTILACINEKCKNPCPGSCGDMARCSVQNHVPLCTCPEGYEGDANIRCTIPLPPSKSIKM